MNKVFLLGRLGSDPEIRYTLSGTPVAHFTIATNEIIVHGNERETHTEWHRLVAFGKLAELCGEHLNKGSKVFVEGKLRNRIFEDRYGLTRKITEIWVERIIFLDSPSRTKTITQDYQSDSIDYKPYEEDLPF